MTVEQQGAAHLPGIVDKRASSEHTLLPREELQQFVKVHLPPGQCVQRLRQAKWCNGTSKVSE